MIWILMLIQFYAAPLTHPMDTDNRRWCAEMDSSFVIPPTNSPGTAKICCGYDTNDDDDPAHCYIEVEYRDLSSPVTGAFLMRGRADEDGSVACTLAAGAFPSDNQFFLHIPLRELRFDEDSSYAVVTTVLYPNGEVRGSFVDQSYPAARKLSWGTLRALFR